MKQSTRSDFFLPADHHATNTPILFKPYNRHPNM